MEKFDAAEFLHDIESGVFDGHLIEEIQKLSHEQLETLAVLMAQRHAPPRRTI